LLSGPIEVDGVRVFCRIQGSGPPALLLHGWGAQGASLEPLTTHLARRYRTIVPDLPGFGASDLPPAPWGVPEYGAAVARLLARLDVSRALVLGHSFGGRLAIWLAAEQPALVDRLILIAAAGIRPPPSARRAVLVRLGRLGRLAAALPGMGGAVEHWRTRWLRAVGAEDYANAGPLRATFVKVVEQDLRALLPRIQAPTLLIWGSQDAETPLRDCLVMAGAIPRAVRVVLQGAGHYVYLERPTQTCQAIDEFLATPDAVWEPPGVAR
jgi:pimeloyl-ACP methyl ester carboxylesterase